MLHGELDEAPSGGSECSLAMHDRDRARNPGMWFDDDAAKGGSCVGQRLREQTHSCACHDERQQGLALGCFHHDGRPHSSPFERIVQQPASRASRWGRNKGVGGEIPQLERGDGSAPRREHDEELLSPDVHCDEAVGVEPFDEAHLGPNAHYYALASVCIGAFMGQLDASIVTVVLPSLQKVFHASVGSVSWVGLSYLIVQVAGVTSVGRLSDMMGRKLLYPYGFVIFILGSGLCGLAPSLVSLDGFRVVQAVGSRDAPGELCGHHLPGHAPRAGRPRYRHSGRRTKLVLSGTMFSVPFFLEGATGASPGRAGPVLTALPLALGCVAPFTGKLTERLGVGTLTVSGMVLSSGTLALLALTKPSGWALGFGLALVGAGLGLLIPPDNASIMSTAARSQAGVASGVEHDPWARHRARSRADRRRPRRRRCRGAHRYCGNPRFRGCRAVPRCGRPARGRDLRDRERPGMRPRPGTRRHGRTDLINRALMLRALLVI